MPTRSTLAFTFLAGTVMLCNCSSDTRIVGDWLLCTPGSQGFDCSKLYSEGTRFTADSTWVKLKSDTATLGQLDVYCERWGTESGDYEWDGSTLKQYEGGVLESDMAVDFLDNDTLTMKGCFYAGSLNCKSESFKMKRIDPPRSSGKCK